ncbi:MAG: hypothetical protein AB1403_24090, partial [Candidatus Riflebacteria bacterium]
MLLDSIVIQSASVYLYSLGNRPAGGIQKRWIAQNFKGAKKCSGLDNPSGLGRFWHGIMRGCALSLQHLCSSVQSPKPDMTDHAKNGVSRLSETPERPCRNMMNVEWMH